MNVRISEYSKKWSDEGFILLNPWRFFYLTTKGNKFNVLSYKIINYGVNDFYNSLNLIVLVNEQLWLCIKVQRKTQYIVKS